MSPDRGLVDGRLGSVAGGGNTDAVAGPLAEGDCSTSLSLSGLELGVGLQPEGERGEDERRLHVYFFKMSRRSEGLDGCGKDNRLPSFLLPLGLI